MCKEHAVLWLVAISRFSSGDVTHGESVAEAAGGVKPQHSGPCAGWWAVAWGRREEQQRGAG